MPYCINPDCQKRENPDDLEHCQTCNTPLLIRDRYRLVRPLRALDKSPRIEVFEVNDNQGLQKVLKILKVSNDTNNDISVQLFEREARVLIWLDHQGIPRVDLDGYFTFTTEEKPRLHCLVMDKIEGQDLEQWLKNQHGPISPNLALKWLKELTEILHQVHQNKLFHRNIKPSNIMRKPNGQLVLIDFGAVRQVTETVINGGNVTAVLTHGYAPPEQYKYQARPQSDFFALGRTFVHLLTGKHPINLSVDAAGQLIWRPSLPQSSREPQFSPLLDFIEELMAPSWQNRPPDTESIQQRIKQIHHSLLGSTIPTPPVPPPPPPPKRSPLPWIITGAALLGLLVVMLLWSYILPPSSLGVLQHDDDVNAVALSPNGQYLITASLDDKAWVWKLPSDEPYGKPLQHGASVVAVSFNRDGTKLATASLDGSVQLAAMTSGSISNIKVLEHDDGVVDVAFSPDGTKLATASADGTARLWDATDGSRIATLDHHNGKALGNNAYVRAVAFSPNGEYVATASLDGTARVWKVYNGGEIARVQHKDSVVDVAFSPDGTKLATASADGTARMWKVPSGESIREPLKYESGGVVAVTFSQDGKYLATVGTEGIARLWDATNGHRIWTVRKNEVNAIAFSPDGKYLATAHQDNNITRVWEREGASNDKYKQVACLKHQDRVVAVTFSADGKYLATASWDNKARVWEVADVTSGNKIACL